MQQNEKKYFLSSDSMLDSDSADFAVSQNAWVNMENVRTGTTDKGVIGTVESVGSTALINSPAEGESYFVIGTADDVDKSRFATFYYDRIGNNHKIECYYTETDTTYTVLLSSDISGQPSSESELVETFQDLVYSTSPHTITFTNSAAVALMAIGDTLSLSGTNLDGTYTISNIAGNNITVLETVTTQNTGIDYFVRITTDGVTPFFEVTGSNLPDPTTIPVNTVMQVLTGAAAGTYHIQTIEVLGRFIYLIETTEIPPAAIGGTTISIKTNGTITVNRTVSLTTGLNFTSAPIHSARIVDNLLYWVEGTDNQPRKINIESAMKAYDPTFVTDQHPYTLPIDFREITVIKPTASLSPNIEKKIDGSFLNNFIANESFEFSFQYIYYDNETTITGTYSPASRLNFPSDTYNYILVTMELTQKIPDTVKIVNLICRTQNGTSGGGDYATIIKTWDKSIITQNDLINLQNSGSNPLTFKFYNNITGQTLAVDDVLRPFDDVPIYSQTLELAKDRLFLANNTEGYDTPTATSLAVNLTNPVSLSYSNQNVLLFKVQYALNGSPDPFSTVHAMQYSGWYINITTGSTPGYYLINTTEIKNLHAVTFPPTPVPLPSMYSPIPTTVTMADLTWKGINFSQIVANTKYQIAGGGLTGGSGLFATTNPCAITDATPNNYNVFTQRSSYKFGIVFYDFAMRKCGVVSRSEATQPVLINTFTETKLTSIASHTIKMENPIALTISPGDIVTIADTISLNGNYIVTDATYASGKTTLTVRETVGTNAVPVTGSISIYRLPSLDITTPTRNYDYTTAFSAIQWSLGNANAINEIPKWAYYYTPVRTLNLRTRFFVQGLNNGAKYATKNTDGTYNFSSSIYNAATTVAIAINTESLNKAGLGYAYTDGDSSILILSNPLGDIVYEIPVIGQAENYILLKSKDIGDLTNQKLIFEVYTPYKTSDQEPYYEMGEMYQISNPGTTERNYTTINGIFKSDAYAFERVFNGISYFAGAMCPNDLYYKRWDNDGGKVNFITRLGQTVNETLIRWSDTYVWGSQINGLSTFRLGGSTNVPANCGGINKLILTSKVQEQGTVMLSICATETNSMYLGETQITDSTGKVQFFGANSSQVISTINTLKGSFGTINPESVTEFRGSVYYADANRGVFVQYSANGLFPISSYKMTRFWKQFFAQYISMTTAEIEALGSRPYIFTTVDASHMELLISIPKLLATPPKGYLPDYPAIIYPFDIWDGQAKTIVYNIETATLPQPHWQGSYSFTPEWLLCISNKLYTMKDGSTWLNNQTDSYNNFYGVQYSSKIMIIANQLPQRPKTYNNVSVESNMKPDFVYFYNDFPYIQTSDLVDIDFKELEGVYYATLYRNKIIPTNTGFTTNGLLIGEYMRNVAMKIMYQFDVATEPLELKFLNIGYTISRGHTT